MEDNSGDVSLIRLALKQSDIERDVVVMTDGDQACKLLDEADCGPGYCPDLIVLDLNLPKKTGREVLQRIRESPAWAKIPVVVFSSSSAETDKKEAAQLGADRYITKPSDLAEFMKIGEVLKTYLH